MGFVWVSADSFLRCAASPFPSVVTTEWLTRVQLCPRAAASTAVGPGLRSTTRRLDMRSGCMACMHHSSERRAQAVFRHAPQLKTKASTACWSRQQKRHVRSLRGFGASAAASASGRLSALRSGRHTAHQKEVNKNSDGRMIVAPGARVGVRIHGSMECSRREVCEESNKQHGFAWSMTAHRASSHYRT